MFQEASVVLKEPHPNEDRTGYCKPFAYFPREMRRYGTHNFLFDLTKVSLQSLVNEMDAHWSLDLGTHRI
jgi:hypothetical protein